MPPFWMKIRIIEKEKTKIRLWFPVILIWLIFFILAVALAPLIFIVSLVLWPSGLGKKLLLFGPIFFYLLCSMHGLNIQTQSPGNQVFISFN